EFARRKVDVIVTTGSSALAVKEAIATVPVVFALLADPIGSGHIANLARPGGNATRLSLQTLDTGATRLQLLRERAARLRRSEIRPTWSRVARRKSSPGRSGSSW